ncbi:MAG: histidine ammonia-lyase [Candidatus Thermoplasmatota archaeon]|jgi:histidine ammonia-lyase|nr:histidine ammonia-lyase [Candidatus Thermoplasmatota archaeon]
MTVKLDGETVTFEDIAGVAKGGERVELTDQAIQRIERCQHMISDLVARGEKIYGVTTGIGELASVMLTPEQGLELQKRIIFSHSASYGDDLPDEDVRAAMASRANVWAKGHSGIRLTTVSTYLEMVNRGVVPVVYEKGSVGCSGDLSPLSQIAEVVIGGGQAKFKGVRSKGKEAMAKAGLEPVVPTFKEGLALINGTQVMVGQMCLLLDETRSLIKEAIIASAMSLDALKTVLKPFDDRVHKVRPHVGQIAVASGLRKLLEGSEILASPSGKVQDGYSMRCTPQIIGPTLDLWHYTRGVIETELNSVVDNPIFFPEQDDFIGAGNFHGQPIGISADVLKIGMSELCDLSERHINRLLNPTLSGLPPFLVKGAGMNSGQMVAQYTAAVLVSENKVLSHPASVDSISVSADQEDHVSMGPVAIRHLKEVCRNTVGVLAIEMLTAAQALDFRKPQRPGVGTMAAYEVIREKVPFLEDDRPLHPDIKAVADLIRSGTIREAVERAVGELEV